jgi:hypothetical protein
MNRFHHHTIWLMLAWLPMILTGCGGEATQIPTETHTFIESSEPAEVSEPTATAEPTETLAPTATSIPPRTLIILSVEGTVQVRSAPDAAWAGAAPGQALTAGAELMTGEDGRATIQLDDGTAASVLANSSFVVQELEGEPENPITRFFLNLGSIFTFHSGELSGAASYEIETPNGVAAVRGTMMSVSYDPDTGQVAVTCLEGHCALSGGGVTVELVEGETVTIEGFDLPPGEVGLMTGAQLDEWIDVLEMFTEDEIDIGVPADALLESLYEDLDSLQGCIGEDCITGEDLAGTLECGEGEDCLPDEVISDLEGELDCLAEGGEGCLDDVGDVIDDVVDNIPPVDTGDWNPPSGGDGGGGIDWP